MRVDSSVASGWPAGVRESWSMARARGVESADGVPPGSGWPAARVLPNDDHIAWQSTLDWKRKRAFPNGRLVIAPIAVSFAEHRDGRRLPPRRHCPSPFGSKDPPIVERFETIHPQVPPECVVCDVVGLCGEGAADSLRRRCDQQRQSSSRRGEDRACRFPRLSLAAVFLRTTGGVRA